PWLRRLCGACGAWRAWTCKSRGCARWPKRSLHWQPNPRASLPQTGRASADARDIKHLRWNTILGIKCSFRLSRPLSDRSARYNRGFFIKHKRKLTTLPILRYSSGHRKHRLKILSMNAARRSANVGTGEKRAVPDFARAYGAGPAEAENAGRIVVPHNNNTDCEKRHERFRLRFRLRRYHHGLRCLHAHRRAIYATGSPRLFRR